MKYYYPEHIAVYERIKREGKRVAWYGADFERFSSRTFLEKAPNFTFRHLTPKCWNTGVVQVLAPVF